MAGINNSHGDVMCTWFERTIGRGGVGSAEPLELAEDLIELSFLFVAGGGRCLRCGGVMAGYRSALISLNLWIEARGSLGLLSSMWSPWGRE